MQKNPVIEMREAKDLSRLQFAQSTGLTYSQVTVVEKGNPMAIPPTWKGKVERVGLNFDELNAAYTSWRQSLIVGEGAAHV